MNHHDDTCAEVQNGLPLFVGDDLEPQAATQIARHLEDCADCRGREREARDARGLLVHALALSERRGPDLWPGVRTQLCEAGLLAARPADRSALRALPGARRPRAWPRYAAAAAAALLLGLWLGRAAFDEADPTIETPGAGEGLVTVPPVHPTVPVLPATSPGGLRRIGGSERPLSLDAGLYLETPWLGTPMQEDPTQATAAGLRRVQ